MSQSLLLSQPKSLYFVRDKMETERERKEEEWKLAGGGNAKPNQKYKKKKTFSSISSKCKFPIELVGCAKKENEKKKKSFCLTVRNTPLIHDDCCFKSDRKDSGLSSSLSPSFLALPLARFHFCLLSSRIVTFIREKKCCLLQVSIDCQANVKRRTETRIAHVWL